MRESILAVALAVLLTVAAVVPCPAEEVASPEVNPVPGVASVEITPDVDIVVPPKGKAERHALDEFRYTETRRDGATYMYGTIHDHVVWKKAKSPYVMTDNVFIAENGTLRIEPGVLIKVYRSPRIKPYSGGTVGLHVFGKLIAIGAPEAMIRFTPYPRSAERHSDWKGIEFGWMCKPSILEWATIEYAATGIWAEGITRIAHCVVRNCHNGIWMREQFRGDCVHNISAFHEYSGLRCHQIGPETRVVNNIVYQALDGIQFADAWAYADYNLYYSKYWGQYVGYSSAVHMGADPGPHDVVADPLFIDPEAGNFTLAVNSPARRAGFGKTDMGLYPEGWSRNSGQEEERRWYAGRARELWHEALRTRSRAAEKRYRQALEGCADPKLKVKIYCSLGAAFISDKQYAKAQLALRNGFALAKTPHLRDLCRRYQAEALESDGKPKEALAVLNSVEWPQSKVWSPRAKVRCAALLGDVAAALRSLRAIKAAYEEPRQGLYEYSRALNEALNAAVMAGKLESALGLLDGYKECPEYVHERSSCLKLAEAFRAKQPEKAVQALKKGLEFEPFSPTAAECLALMTEILERDLGKADEAAAARLRLALNYYPEIPVVAAARAALGDKLPVVPRNKMILLDGSLGESPAFEKWPPGSHTGGQQDVIRILSEAGYTTHSSQYRESSRLTREFLKSYGLVILNGGGSRTWGELTVPQEVIEVLVDYVKDGGSLVVVASGYEGWSDAQFHNPLVGRFGVRFEVRDRPLPGVDCLVTDHPAVRGLKGFYADGAIELRIDSGEVLGNLRDKPVLALATHGRGKVVVAGIARGFRDVGFSTSSPWSAERAVLNKALLLRLAEYLTSEQ
ncbi:MAG: hypothetical protein Q7T82_12320 [Armatimonadota bacterium]|nr:hypothetical protein [Armatimonadota bacterium]